MGSPSTTVFDVLGWIEVNKQRLLKAAVVLTLIGFGIATYRWMAHEKEVKASSTLIQLKNPAVARGATNMPTATDLLKVQSEFGGTTAAERASFLAGGVLFGDNKYDEARQQFEKFLKEYPNSIWAPDAAYGLAVSLDALEKLNEAVAAYQNVLTRYGAASVAGQAQLGLARVYESQNKPDQALKIYEELSKSLTSSTWASEARTRMEQLFSRFPQLPRPSATAPTAAPTIKAAPSAAKP